MDASTVSTAPVNPMISMFTQMMASLSEDDKKAFFSQMASLMPAPPAPAPASVGRKGKKADSVAPVEQMEGAPTAADYRLKEEEIDHTTCLARKINGTDKSKIREWKPIIYRELQCGKKRVEGEDLCLLCKTKSELYTGSEGTWWGLVTEEPPSWMHMLGTAWAAKSQPRWLGSAASAASVSASDETETVVSSDSATSRKTVAALQEENRQRRLAEKEAARAQKLLEKEAEKAKLKAAKEAEKAELKALKEAEKKAEKEKKAAEKEAEKKAEKEKKDAEKAAAKSAKSSASTGSGKKAAPTKKAAAGGAGAAPNPFEDVPSAVAVSTEDVGEAELVIRMFESEFYALKTVGGVVFAYSYDQETESVGECVGKALLDGTDDMEIAGIDVSVKA